MVFLIEIVCILLFVSIAGSQIVWPWVNNQPFFPDLRPDLRRQRKLEEEISSRGAKAALDLGVSARPNGK
jgi:hypothetical protein